MIASLESETPQNAERGIETGIPFEVDSRIDPQKRASNSRSPKSRRSGRDADSSGLILSCLVLMPAIASNGP
jgi:hypothetical protein